MEINLNEIYSIYSDAQSLSNDVVKALLHHNSAIFDNIISYLRSFETNVTYQNQKLYPGYANLLNHSQNLKSGFVVAKVEGDGNCFYYSISMLLFGHTQKYNLIKIASAFILIKYENLFNSIINSTKTKLSFDDILRRACCEEMWATEFHILATSILFNRPIYVYTDHNWHHDYTLNAEHSLHEPLCIIHVHSSHFMPLIPVSKSSKATSPEQNQFIKFFDPNDKF